MRFSTGLPNFTGYFLDNGRYELQECLGSGAYGTVYKALDRTSSKESPSYVAVKCLLKYKTGSRDEEFQLREITLHKKVSGHPNIVTIHEVLYDDLFVFVILDYCGGGDLFGAIAESQSFDNGDENVRRMFLQVLDAVQYCHDAGVFHRDLKPENVLCSTDGLWAGLADFGLCTDKRVSDEFGCGSSHYMSPECLNKDGPVRSHYFPRQNDIWALGVILVNLITARTPWILAVLKDEHFSAFSKDQAYLRELLPVSEEVYRLLIRIFELNPLRRISLPNLRKEIMAIKTFHPTELPAPPLPARQTPRHKPQVHTVYTEEVPSSSDESASGSDFSFNSVQVSTLPHAGPTPLADLLEKGLQITPQKVALPPRYSRWCGNSDPWDADTDSESDTGPVTPASVAVEPVVDVVVPDLCLGGDGLNEEDMPTPKIGQQPFLTKAAAVMKPKYLARGFAKIRKELIR